MDAITKGAVFTYVELDHSFGEATVSRMIEAADSSFTSSLPVPATCCASVAGACRPTHCLDSQ